MKIVSHQLFGQEWLYINYGIYSSYLHDRSLELVEILIAPAPAPENSKRLAPLRLQLQHFKNVPAPGSGSSSPALI